MEKSTPIPETPTKSLMVNRTKLVTPKTYAARKGLTERAVKYQIEKKQVATDDIDGVVFIKID